MGVRESYVTCETLKLEVWENICILLVKINKNCQGKIVSISFARKIRDPWNWPGYRKFNVNNRRDENAERGWASHSYWWCAKHSDPIIPWILLYLPREGVLFLARFHPNLKIQRDREPPVWRAINSVDLTFTGSRTIDNISIPLLPSFRIVVTHDDLLNRIPTLCANLVVTGGRKVLTRTFSPVGS